MEKEYLSEEKYEKTKRILKIIGFVCLTLGIILLIASFFIKVPEMGQEGWYDAEGRRIFLRALAFIFGLMAPMVILPIAYGREILSFQAQQVMPVSKEGIEKMAPTAGVVAKEITKGIKEGLKEDSENEEK